MFANFRKVHRDMANFVNNLIVGSLSAGIGLYRSRKVLKKNCLLAKNGTDTAENGPAILLFNKVWQNVAQSC